MKRTIPATHATLHVMVLLMVLGISSCGTEPTVAVENQLSAPTLAILVPNSGTYSRKISTESVQAQQFFDQGLRLAWGFYFPESIASYQQAAIFDPDHPMPYWGMAHAMGPNPNSRYARMPDDPQGEGLKAITQAIANIDRATPLEAEMINALWVFYNKDSIPDDEDRDRAYLAAMRVLNERYPDDADVAALYAASYMNIGRWDYWDAEGNPKGETIQVAEALERIINQDLTNPGVMHLHIHLLEASMEPERALISADNLEKTVPIAGHVVHMPAHIYVRVGDFQKAIDQNVRSQEVDKQFAQHWGDLALPNIGTYPLSHKIHAGHAIDFIRYAATVQGNYETAITAALSAKEKALTYNNVHRYQKTIAAPWLINKIFGRWDQLIGHEPSHSDLPYLDGIHAYALGSALLATGDMQGATEQMGKLQAIVNAPDADKYRAGPTPVSSILKLAALGLAGEMMQAKGDYDSAISVFKEAVALEDLNNYTEPPDWAQPMRHYLGAALLAAGKSEEAEVVYRRDLRWNHNNGWSLFGLQQALEAQGKKAQAAEVGLQFKLAWRFADVELVASHL